MNVIRTITVDCTAPAPVVMADPECNEFCVERSDAERGS